MAHINSRGPRAVHRSGWDQPGRSRVWRRHSEEIWGPAEIRGNAVEDLAALNKVETLPRGEWGSVRRPRWLVSFAGVNAHDRVATETEFTPR